MGSHLYRAFPKLGITTRASLSGALAGKAAAPADTPTWPTNEASGAPAFWSIPIKRGFSSMGAKKRRLGAPVKLTFATITPFHSKWAKIYFNPLRFVAGRK